MTFLLRHGGAKAGLTLDDEGWADAGALAQLVGVSMSAVEEIVRDCAKQRFEWHPTRTPRAIRATQGHTLKDVRVDLAPLDSAVGHIVHGTFRKTWPLIKADGALDPQKRQHVHFVHSLRNVLQRGCPAPQPGIRTGASVLIYVNVARALAAGVSLGVSANGVVLASGRVPLHTVDAVVDRLTFASLDPDFPNRLGEPSPGPDAGAGDDDGTDDLAAAVDQLLHDTRPADAEIARLANDCAALTLSDGEGEVAY
jgi:RNA:NAD 2'-phosphotransferase (TPT1/KptA family)